MHLIYGERDRGVLGNSINSLRNSNLLEGERIVCFKNLGHKFGGKIEERCISILSKNYL